MRYEINVNWVLKVVLSHENIHFDGLRSLVIIFGKPKYSIQTKNIPFSI